MKTVKGLLVVCALFVGALALADCKDCKPNKPCVKCACKVTVEDQTMPEKKCDNVCQNIQKVVCEQPECYYENEKKTVTVEVPVKKYKPAVCHTENVQVCTTHESYGEPGTVKVCKQGEPVEGTKISEEAKAEHKEHKAVEHKEKKAKKPAKKMAKKPVEAVKPMEKAVPMAD